jgi:ABC-type transport system involved in cytochrome c biogenesis permease subunit
LSGVTILCFGASYAVAFGLELSRLLFQSRVRRVVLLGFVIAGLGAHTIFLVYSGASAQSNLPPLSSLYDWLLVVAWILVALYLYLSAWYHDLALGVFLLPIVLGLVGAAAWFVEPTPRKLVQARRLKSKSEPILGFRLPSLELLERVNHRALILAFALLTLGFGSGVVLAWLHRSVAAVTPSLVAAVLVWIAFAVLLHLQRRHRLRGRKDAWLSIFAFVLLIGLVLIELDQGRLHGGRDRPAGTAPPSDAIPAFHRADDGDASAERLAEGGGM